MFDVDKISDFEEPAAGGPSLPGGTQWQRSIEVSAVKEEYATAMQVVESSITEYKRRGEPIGEAAALLAKAKLYHAQGKNDEAQEAAEEALAKYRSAGDSKGEATCLHVLARLHLDSKIVEEAEKTEAIEQSEKVAKEALDLFKTALDKTGQAAVLNTLAKVHFTRGNPDEAVEIAEKAEMIFKEVGDKNGEAAAILTKSLVYLFWGSGKWEQASKLAKQAVGLCKEVTEPSAQHREADAWLLICAANIPMMKGEEALQAATSALSLMENLGGDYKLALALRAVAFAQAVVGNLDDAVNQFERARRLADATGDKALKATLMVCGSVVHRIKLWGAKNAGKTADNSQDEALRLGRQAVDLFTEMSDWPSAALTRVELAQAMILAGDVDAGLAEASSAKDFFESMENISGQAIAYLTLAEGLQVQGGQVEPALGCARRAQELFAQAGGAGEGTKAAGELLDILGAEARQKRETGSWGAIDHGSDGQGVGGVSRAMYTKLFALTIYSPDRPYEVMLDAPVMQGMDQVAASMARQQQVAQKTPSRQRAEGGGKAGPARAEGQSLRPVPLKEPERVMPPVVTPVVLGSDMLGGRSWDCPEDVHARMLEMATRGDLPVSRPEQRAKNMNKRPTFYGAAEWRDAVKMGYIHPDMPAPRGLKWRKVTMGWKLLEA